MAYAPVSAVVALGPRWLVFGRRDPRPGSADSDSVRSATRPAELTSSCRGSGWRVASRAEVTAGLVRCSLGSGRLARWAYADRLSVSQIRAVRCALRSGHAGDVSVKCWRASRLGAWDHVALSDALRRLA